MKLKIKNFRIAECINLLDEVPLKGMKSILRTRLSRNLGQKLERVLREDNLLKEEFCEKDEEGEFKKVNDIYQMKEGREYSEFLIESNKLASEEIIIKGEEEEKMLKSIKDSLENCDIEWKGDTAYTFEYLYESLIDESKESEDDIKDSQ